MLTLELYRRHVVNFRNIYPVWDQVILELTKSDSEKYKCSVTGFLDWISYKNHPLVNSGYAYWINDRELCLGYKLKSNELIFRPIFCNRRQDLINTFQEKISKIVLKREEKLLYIELARIKRLPIEIVDNIIRLAY